MAMGRQADLVKNCKLEISLLVLKDGVGVSSFKTDVIGYICALSRSLRDIASKCLHTTIIIIIIIIKKV